MKRKRVNYYNFAHFYFRDHFQQENRLTATLYNDDLHIEFAPCIYSSLLSDPDFETLMPKSVLAIVSLCASISPHPSVSLSFSWSVSLPVQ